VKRGAQLTQQEVRRLPNRIQYNKYNTTGSRPRRTAENNSHNTTQCSTAVLVSP